MTANQRNYQRNAVGVSWEGTAVLRPYQQKRLDKKKAAEQVQSSIIYNMLVIFILLHFLGFPGKLTKVFGDKIETLVDYGCFVLQLGLMLASSSDTVLEIKLLNFKAKYRALYLFAVVLIMAGMVLSTDKKAELITCLRLLTTVCFATWLVERYTPTEILNLYYKAQLMFLLFVVFFIVRYKGYAYAWYDGVYTLVGLSNAKNETAAELCFGVLIQITLIRMKLDNKEPLSISFLMMLPIQGMLLMMAKGMGSLICVVVPSFYLFFLEKKIKKRLPLGFVYVIGSVGFLLIAMTIIPLFEPLLEMMGKDATLTGRIPMWNHLLNMMMNDHTLFGYGYERFWKNETAMRIFHAGFSKNSWFSTMTFGCHNVTMEMLVNTGLVGVSAYFLMIIDALRTVPRMNEEQYNGSLWYFQN